MRKYEEEATMTHLLTALRDVVRLQDDFRMNPSPEKCVPLSCHAASIDFPALLTMLEEAQRVIETYAAVEKKECDDLYMMVGSLSYDMNTPARDYLAKYGEQK